MPETATLASSPAPVMDVVAPPVEKSERQEAVADAVDPLDQLVAEDQQSQQKTETAPDTAEPKPASKATPKQHADSHGGSGIGMAITATVVIIFGLAFLATFAYIQTNR